MMKINNEKEILDLFVEKGNCYREELKTPFIEETDGRVWASDGHSLIMINKECVSGEYETRKKTLDVKDYNTNYEIPVSALVDAIDNCPKEQEVIIHHEENTCPECNGKGTVYADYRAEYDDKDYEIEADCPICEGEGTISEKCETMTGNMIPKKNSVIKIGKGYFKAPSIQRVIKVCQILSVESIRILRNYRNEMSIFGLSDDVHIVVMPMWTDKDEFDTEVKLTNK